MSAREIRSSIEQILENTHNEKILEAYYQILLNLLHVQEQAALAFDGDNQPLTQEQLKQEAAAASSRVASGKSISHEDVIKRAIAW